MHNKICFIHYRERIESENREKERNREKDKSHENSDFNSRGWEKDGRRGFEGTGSSARGTNDFDVKGEINTLKV
jgi:hypothetical protein